MTHFPPPAGENIYQWIDRQPWTETGKQWALKEYKRRYRLDLNPPTLEEWDAMASARGWYDPTALDAIAAAMRRHPAGKQRARS